MLIRFRWAWIAIPAMILSACQTVIALDMLQSQPQPQSTARSAPIQTITRTPATDPLKFHPSASPPVTAVSTSTATPTHIPPSHTPSSTASPVHAPTVIAQTGVEAFYETLFAIPVGEGSIQYFGGDAPDMEINGPTALAVLPDGSFVVADVVGNRLWQYDYTGQLIKSIDLYTMGIVSVVDARANSTELFLMGISPDIRSTWQRVYRLSFEGELKASYTIPEMFQIDNALTGIPGLTGIAIDCDGEILLELEGGSELYRLVNALGNLDPDSKSSGYDCNGKQYRVINPSPGKTPNFMAGSIKLKTQLTFGFGGFRLLGVLPDGSFYLIREDVVTDPVIKVDQTVHYMGADGGQQGVARVPIAEYYYPIMRNLAVGPDGNVYGLLPRPDSVKIIRLNFYTSLEPLIPGAVAPLVTVATTDP